MAVVRLNEVLITSKVANATSTLKSPLYNIESNNTTEARTQSVSTATRNEHTVQKFSNESTISTKISGGFFEIIPAFTRTTQADPFFAIVLKK